MNWKSIIGGIAPTVATVLGGPFAGIAVDLIGKAFGMENATVDKVKNALEAGQMTGEQLLAIKQAEIELQKFLEEKQIRLEELAAADTASARDMQKNTMSPIPGLLSIGVTIGFFGILSWLMIGGVPPNSEPLMIMLGALGTAWASIIGFWFGSSHGSSVKSELLAKR